MTIIYNFYVDNFLLHMILIWIHTITIT